MMKLMSLVCLFATATAFAEPCAKVAEAGWRVVNVDASVILEKPKLAPHKEAMRSNIARVLGIEEDRVNIKGKTHEKVDSIGEGRAIEVHVVALLEKQEEE